MLRILSQNRRLTLVILLTLFTCLLFLSFVPTSHSYYSYYTTSSLANSPSSTSSGTPPPTTSPDPTDPKCDPFQRQTHLHFNHTFPLESYFTTYDPSCKTSSPLWLSQLFNLEPTDPPLPAFKDKTILFIGDSVDRFLVRDLCELFNGTWAMHPNDSYKKTINEALVQAHHALPRTCFIDGPSEKQGLVLMTYFFYGFDEDDMWRDKTATWSQPPRFKERWEMFRDQAYPSMFGEQGILSSRGEPDLVVVNMGYWELARYDRLDEHRQLREGVDQEEIVDPVTVSESFVAEFVEKTVDVLGRIRSLVGDKARIRWRQLHVPSISTGSYFIDHNTGTKKKSRGRFTPVKVNVLNEAAEWACEVASEREVERRRKAREQEGGKGWWRRVSEKEDEVEDGRVTVWPVGELMAPWPTAQWLRDDIHPTGWAGAVVWGNGVLEYLARTPGGRERHGPGLA